MGMVNYHSLWKLRMAFLGRAANRIRGRDNSGTNSVRVHPVSKNTADFRREVTKGPLGLPFELPKSLHCKLVKKMALRVFINKTYLL